MGIKILIPDVNKSKSLFVIEDNSIRYGLHAIKNVGSISPVSANNLQDFIRLNPKLNKRMVESLVKAGAIPGEETIAQKLTELSRIISSEGRIQQCKEKIEEFTQKGNNKKVLEWQVKLKEAQLITVENIVIDSSQVEREVLGFNLQFSPFEKYRQFLTNYGTLNYFEFQSSPIFKGRFWIEEEVKRSLMIVGGMIESVKELKTKTEKQYILVTLKTIDNGTIKVYFWDKHYKEYKKELFEGIGKCCRIKATKSFDDGCSGISIHWLDVAQE